MHKIDFRNLEVGQKFNKDVYILDDLIFVPANCKIQEYHLKSMLEYKIENIATDGQLVIKPKSENEETVNNKKLSIDDDFNYKNIEKQWQKEVYEIFTEIKEYKTVDKDKTKKLIDQFNEVINHRKNEVLEHIGHKDQEDSYLIKKSIDVTLLSLIIGKSMGMNDLRLIQLGIGALFHDIGMLQIPREILVKNKTLNGNEKEVIQKHTIVAYRLLLDIGYSQTIASVALQDHESLDGNGYPQKLQKDKINDYARIIRITDSYCSALFAKPFRDALHGKEVITDLLKGGGSKYDSAFLKILITNISLYPIGSFVILSNEQIAKVTGVSGIPIRPIVRIYKNKNFEDEINLSKRKDIFIKGIIKDKDRTK